MKYTMQAAQVSYQPPGRPPLQGPRYLRKVARPDVLTAQRVEVGVIFQAMLGTVDAARYLALNQVPLHVALRVLTRHHQRRRSDTTALA